MGKYRFTRANPVVGSRYNEINFDSSPNGSLCRMYGYHPKAFELRETGRKLDEEIYYDVFAKNSVGGEPYGEMDFRGKLREMTDEMIWRRLL